MKQTIVIISILILSVSFLKAQGQVITKDYTTYRNSNYRTYAFQSFYDTQNSPANCSPVINENLTYLGMKFPGRTYYDMDFAYYNAVLRTSLTSVNYNKVINRRSIYFNFILDVSGNVLDCSLSFYFEPKEAPIVFSTNELNTLFRYLREIKHGLILPEGTNSACLINYEIGFNLNRVMKRI